MKIGNIQNYNYFYSDKNRVFKTEKQYPCSVSFASNYQPKIDKEIFFIKLKTYKTNEDWANIMAKETCAIARAISNGADFDDIIKMAENGVKKAYGSNHRIYSLIKRKEKENPFFLSNSPYDRGAEYYHKFCKKLDCDGCYKPVGNFEYPFAHTSDFIYDEDDGILTIFEGWEPYNSNLDLAREEFEKLRKIKNPTQNEIDKSIATISWLIYQESPWFRGTDSIVNLLSKSIYSSYNVQLSPVKEGVSLDFEAWYRDLDDYINIYPGLYEIPPTKQKPLINKRLENRFA